MEKQQDRANCAPCIEIAVIDDWRVRAHTLAEALAPWAGHIEETVPYDLREQVHKLASEADQRLGQSIMHYQRQADLWWYVAMPLRRNDYCYCRQAVWTRSSNERRYITYDSRLSGEVHQVIWDPCDWECWSPGFGVKRDMVTWYGAPAIIHELAHGAVLDDMAGLPLSYEEMCDLRRYRLENPCKEDMFPGHSEFEHNALDAAEHAKQEWGEHLEMLYWESEERVRDDIYLD